MKGLRFVIPLAVFGVLVAFLAVGLKLAFWRAWGPRLRSKFARYTLTNRRALVEIREMLEGADQRLLDEVARVEAAACAVGEAAAGPTYEVGEQEREEALNRSTLEADIALRHRPHRSHPLLALDAGPPSRRACHVLAAS